MTTKRLVITIPKRQHRFVIGPKGSNLNSVFENTGCIVDVPQADDPCDQILILGPEKTLTLALKEILENVTIIN